MPKLAIDNLNIYKSFRKSSYTIETAVAEFVDNSVDAFSSSIENKTIIIFWNLDENWLQIIDNAKGISKDKVNNIFRVFNSDEKLGIGLKNAAFFLGNKLTIESKNDEQNFGFKTQLNINDKNVDSAPIVFVEPKNILRSFKSATRITIEQLTKTLSQDRINQMYFCLSKLFKNYIDDVNILVAIKKENTIYDISQSTPTPVPSLNDIKRLKFVLPEYNNSSIINFEDEITSNGKTIKIKGRAYKLLVNNNFSGILLSNDKRTIIGANNLYKPKWFDNSFSHVFVDVSISNVDTNVTKNWLIWDDKTQQLFDNFIYNQIKDLKTIEHKKSKPLIDSKRFTNVLVDDNSEINHLETSKLYLTKALSTNDRQISDFEIIKNKLHFNYTCDDGKKISINLLRKKDKNSDNWLQLIPLSQNEIEQTYEFELIYNASHPFFKQFDKDNYFSHKMEYFVISYAISETICRLDGLNVTDLKYEISKLLKGFENDY